MRTSEVFHSFAPGDRVLLQIDDGLFAAGVIEEVHVAFDQAGHQQVAYLVRHSSCSGPSEDVFREEFVFEYPFTLPGPGSFPGQQTETPTPEFLKA